MATDGQADVQQDVQEGLRERAQRSELEPEESAEAEMERSWTRVESSDAGRVSSTESPTAGHISWHQRLAAGFCLPQLFRCFSCPGGPDTHGTSSSKEDLKEEVLAPLKFLLYFFFFLLGALLPMGAVNLAKAVFENCVKVVGWRACAASALCLLMAPSRQSIDVPSRLAAFLGWVAAVWVSIAPHVPNAVVSPVAFAFLYSEHAQEENCWYTSEDFSRMLQLLENVASLNVVRAAVRTTFGTLLGSVAQMWMVTQVLEFLRDVLQRGVTRGLCFLSAMAGCLAACCLHSCWLSAPSLALSADASTAIALALAVFHLMMPKIVKKNRTKQGRTVLTVHLVAMNSLFYDAYSKGEMCGAVLFSPVCFFCILVGCKVVKSYPKWADARYQRDY